MQRPQTRRGFTLPEVLVTLAIVATLAAVLLPALNQQLSKGDAGRVASDLTSVRTAIGAFTSDVRRFPDSLRQLSTPIVNPNPDILGIVYPASLIARWRGPYLSKSLIGDSLPTAFGATVRADFDIASIGSPGVNYLRIHLSSLGLADFNRVDVILDEVADSLGGQFRRAAATSTAAHYYAVPIQ